MSFLDLIHLMLFYAILSLRILYVDFLILE